MSNQISVLSIQTTAAFKEATPEGKSDYIKLVLVDTAYREYLSNEETRWESETDLVKIKEFFTLKATEVVNQINELYPLPFDETVAYVAEALYSRHLLFCNSDGRNRLKAIATLLGLSNIDVSGLSQ